MSTVTIKWLPGNYYIGGETRGFVHDIGVEPQTTPNESSRSNERSKTLVRTIDHDSMRISQYPDTKTFMRELPAR